MSGDDYCYLTTTGRRSGRPHRIEIWYAADGDTLYLLAGGGTSSDWVRNLIADPVVAVELDGRDRTGCARVLGTDPRGIDSSGSSAGAAEEERARTLVFDKYQPRNDGDLTSWRASALPVVIELEPIVGDGSATGGDAASAPPTSASHPVRVAPTTEADWDDETRALVGGAGGLNIFRTLAHHPKALKRWLVFGAHVLGKSTLSARDRELVILRTGWRCGSEYEFGQHTVIGKGVGISDDEVRRLALDPLDGWSADDAALLRAVDELVADHGLSDAAWAPLAERFGEQELIDLVFAVGQYVMVSMALNTFGVQREEGVPGWPT